MRLVAKLPMQATVRAGVGGRPGVSTPSASSASGLLNYIDTSLCAIGSTTPAASMRRAIFELARTVRMHRLTLDVTPQQAARRAGDLASQWFGPLLHDERLDPGLREQLRKAATLLWLPDALGSSPCPEVEAAIGRLIESLGEHSRDDSEGAMTPIGHFVTYLRQLDTPEPRVRRMIAALVPIHLALQSQTGRRRVGIPAPMRPDLVSGAIRPGLWYRVFDREHAQARWLRLTVNDAKARRLTFIGLEANTKFVLSYDDALATIRDGTFDLVDRHPAARQALAQLRTALAAA